MAVEHEQLSETHIVGDDTQQLIVRADDCAVLEQRHISHVGFGDAAVPYRIVRTRLSGAYIHGSLGGEGRMLLDGRWRSMHCNMMSFAPAHGLHAFHAVPEKRWQYCWLRYLPSAPRSVVGTIAPIMQHSDPEPMKHAILGLYSEVFHGPGDPASCVMWIDIIERYISRFVDPWRRDTRIVAVFDAVMPTLARHWTIEEMAEIAHVSTEHLRRISRKVFGRSPIQQLTQLRMQHATHLLATSGLSIEEIAERVGYCSPFAFSKAFKRMNGVSPSHFRLHARG